MYNGGGHRQKNSKFTYFSLKLFTLVMFLKCICIKTRKTKMKKNIHIDIMLRKYQIIMFVIKKVKKKKYKYGESPIHPRAILNHAPARIIL